MRPPTRATPTSGRCPDRLGHRARRSAPSGHSVVAILDTGVDRRTRPRGRLLPGVSFVDGTPADTGSQRPRHVDGGHRRRGYGQRSGHRRDRLLGREGAAGDRARRRRHGPRQRHRDRPRLRDRRRCRRGPHVVQRSRLLGRAAGRRRLRVVARRGGRGGDRQRWLDNADVPGRRPRRDRRCVHRPG